MSDSRFLVDRSSSIVFRPYTVPELMIEVSVLEYEDAIVLARALHCDNDKAAFRALLATKIQDALKEFVDGN